MDEDVQPPLLLEEKLRLLPDTPGVYLMKDEKDEVLYVGKSKCLKDRVRSYFQKTRPSSPRIRKMTERVTNIETLVTRSELDALKAGQFEQMPHRLGLPVADFHDQRTAGREHAKRGWNEAAVDFEAVLPGKEGHCRLVLAHLNGKCCALPERHVRRVGDDQIEAMVLEAHEQIGR